MTQPPLLLRLRAATLALRGGDARRGITADFQFLFAAPMTAQCPRAGYPQALATGQLHSSPIFPAQSRYSAGRPPRWSLKACRYDFLQTSNALDEVALPILPSVWRRSRKGRPSLYPSMSDPAPDRPDCCCGADAIPPRRTLRQKQ